MKKPNDYYLYQQLLTINEQTFQAGNYNAAYHALTAALYCAQDINSDEPLRNIIKTALQELEWIDQNQPEYEHASQSARRRHQTDSIFSKLATQAETRLKMRHVYQLGKRRL